MHCDKEKLLTSIKRDKIVWRNNALSRMLKRGIAMADVKKVLMEADSIELYPSDMPFPSALYFGEIDGRALHVAASMDVESGYVYVISAYDPDDQHFEADKRTRRRKQ